MGAGGNSDPQFPLRVIFDDGQLDLIETPEELLDRMDSIDTMRDRNHVWVRDDLGRTVHLRMVNGDIEVFQIV